MAESKGCAKALRRVTRGGALSTSSPGRAPSNNRDGVATAERLLYNGGPRLRRFAGQTPMDGPKLDIRRHRRPLSGLVRMLVEPSRNIQHLGDVMARPPADPMRLFWNTHQHGVHV